jgi:hypothetical protein
MGATIRQSLVIVLMLLGIDPKGTAQGSSAPRPGDQTSLIAQDLVATRVFEDRVNEYVTLHRLLEGPLPPLRSTTNMDEIRINMKLLTDRMVVARQHARQGDIITTDVARMFRRRLATCLSPEEWAAILAELAEDEQGVPVPPVALRVNIPWPEQVSFGFVPPQLLQALPPLPVELEYRIIGRSLVLWDHHANLIVDFLPAAFTT